MDMGWFLLLVVVGVLVSAVAYGARRFQPDSHAPRRPAPPRPPVVPLSQPMPAAPVDPVAMPAPLPLRHWFDKVNHQPDKTPHLAASGPSGSGKTTLILAALHDRPGRFVIVTPKSQRADPWGGLPVIRLRPDDMSFQPIAQAVEAVYAEMLRRNAHDADVEDDWLTLVIDEFSTVIGKLPDLREKILDMVTLGRSSRIRIIILATETNVKAWGWEGRGEARHNVLFIECEEDTHAAVIYRWNKEKQPVDTSLLPSIARRPLDSRRWWSPPSVPDDDTALQPWGRAVTALERGERYQTDRQTDRQTGTKRAETAQKDACLSDLSDEEVKRAMIAWLLSHDITQERVRRLVKGDTNKINELVREALDTAA